MRRRLLIAELALLLASVLIFRGLWLLLDTLPIMREPIPLFLSLVVGIAVTIPALRYIIRRG